MLRCFFAAALTGAAWTSSLGAQSGAQPTAPSLVAVARGVVTDSLHGGALAGAFVMVEGAGRGAAGDAAGRFLVDSIPPGTYRLMLVHPLLDTLGLQVVTRPTAFAGGDTVRLVLSVPSAQTIVRAKCGTQPLPGGPAAVLGLVVNGETEDPVDGAAVVLAWTDYHVSRETGLRRQPRQRIARSLADGTYRICGVPAELAADIYASSGSDTTAVIPIALGTVPLAIRTLALPVGGFEVVEVDTATSRRATPGTPRPRAARLRRGQATVRGTVTTSSGTPIVGARVSVAGAVGATVTDDRGRFALVNQPAGSQTVVVRRLGYEVVEIPANLSSRTPRDLDVRLSEFVPVLETVRVQAARDDGLSRVGFLDRKRTGMGKYLSAEDIQRRAALRVVDLLSQMPNLHIVGGSGSERTVVGRMRGSGYGCVQWYVDGFPWMGEGSPGDFMTPEEIGALEVYSASMVPSEFQRSFQNCETVVIWTKHKLGIR